MSIHENIPGPSQEQLIVKQVDDGVQSSNMSGLISFEEAFGLLLGNLNPPEPLSFRLEESLGGVLSREILADVDVPPFEKALMDGFAVRSADLGEVPAVLSIVGEASAGQPARQGVGPGQAVRIMTGAVIPGGADAVQRVEDTVTLDEERVEIRNRVKVGQNIAPRASEVKAGQVVLPAGTVIGPAQLAVLATFGCHQVPCFRRPSVLILATGDELVPIDAKPGPGQIRNSNSVMIKAQCSEAGIAAQTRLAVADDAASIRRILEETSEFDFVIFSGGVSMGEKDYVHKVLRQGEAEIVFHKAAVKPGKPILFARRGKQMIFGLPGNPVSSYVTFELFVRPALRAALGHRTLALPRQRAILSDAVRQKPGRLFFKAATLDRSGLPHRVTPVHTAGSGDITAFARSNALILVPADRAHLEAGTEVEVIPLPVPEMEGHLQ